MRPAGDRPRRAAQLPTRYRRDGWFARPNRVRSWWRPPP